MKEQEKGFVASFSSGRQLFWLFKIVSVVTRYVPLTINENGIEIRALDDSHTYMIELLIPKDAFFEFFTKKELFIEVDTEEFLRALPTEKDECVTFKQQGRQLLVLHKIGEHALEFEERERKLSPLKVDFDVEALLRYKELKRALSFLKQRETFSISYEKQKLHFGTQKVDTISVKAKQPFVNTNYPLQKLRALTAQIKHATALELAFGRAKPVCFCFLLPLLYTLKAVRLRFYLAPQET